MNKARILIVEDEVIEARDLSELITELGYETVGCVRTGEEVSRHMDEKQPDLVLMDIQLAGDMDGIEAAKIIRDRHSVPVVFLTAFSGDLTLNRAKTIEPYGYIIKPFDRRDLRIALDIALYKHRVQREQLLTAELLKALNRHTSLRGLMQEVTLMFQQFFACEAVGVRLQNSDGFPYYETRGFPPEFVEMENHIVLKDADGRTVRDENQHPILECMCGNVLCEKFDPQKPTFTRRGSFWTNSTTDLAAKQEAASIAAGRNGCGKQGYESVALVPLRIHGKTLGLIQLNDRRKNRFTSEFVAFVEHLADNLSIGIAHRLAQEGMQEARERFESLFEGISDAVYVLSFPLGNQPASILGVNNAACKMLGYEKDELLQLRLSDIDAPESKVDARAIVADLSRGKNLTFEQVHVTRTGKRIPVEIHAWAINLHGRKVVMSTVRDITDRKELEAQLRQAQKMEAVGTLAGGIAHDFNNILAAMLLNLDFLQTDAAISPSTKSSLKELQNEAERAASLTRQLLTFSQQKMVQRMPVDLNEVVHNMLKMIRRLLGEQIQVQFQAAPDLPRLSGDIGMFEQVLMNLSVNARDAMPAGGTLSINTRVAYVDETHPRLSADIKPGRYVCLTARDTGCGMDEETSRRAFEPYYTTKEQGKGSGLGLAIVHGIITQHKGWIDVKSKMGSGATFEIYLPADESPPIKPSQVVNALTEMSHGNEAVLVVEDEASLRNIIARCLRSCGYQVLEASSYASALETWRNSDLKIALILTDMVLPEGKTGLQLVKELKDLNPDLHVIITSGYAAELITNELDKLGGVFLCKPYDANTLSQCVRDCLDGKSKPPRVAPIVSPEVFSNSGAN